MSALRAGPPSPANPVAPVPAMVEMMPLVPMRRRTLLVLSAMTILPDGSQAMPVMFPRDTFCAGTPEGMAAGAGVGVDQELGG